MRILTLLTLFVFLPAITTAQTFGGVGTRAEGMGGAFVAVADDASAVYWNPAGLATGATFDFQVSGGDSERGRPLFVGVAMPVLGLSYYRTHTVQGAPDRQQERAGDVPIRTLTTANAGITVVQTVVSGLVIGTTARLVRGGVETFDTRSTVDLDAGVMVSAGSVRLGIAGRNLREPEFDSDAGPVAIERQVRVGAAFAPRSLPSGVHGPFSLAFDVDLTRTPGISGDLRMAAAGGEYWIAGGRVGARAGVRWNTLEDGARALSGGLTFRLPRSMFIEGQMTKPEEGGAAEWNIGVRSTF